GPVSVLRGCLPAAVLMVVVLLAGLVIVLLDGSVSRPHRLSRFEQPSTITYPDDSRHYIGLLERRSLVFGRVVEHQLYVGRTPDMSYGHVVELGFTGANRPVLTGASWEQGGVRARFASGHEVFVPARYFLHGR
ncbi:hypothetical protein ACFQ07_15975, partial [Actinomadura adrarensis]